MSHHSRREHGRVKRDLPAALALHVLQQRLDARTAQLAAARQALHDLRAEREARCNDAEHVCVLLGGKCTGTNAASVHDQLHWLAEASAMLGSSLDFKVTLASAAQAVVPFLADGCLVHLVSAGEITQVATTHANRPLARLVEAMATRYPPIPAFAHGTFEVVRTGHPEMHAKVSDAYLQSMAHDAEQLRLLRGSGMRSLMIVPMAVGGHVLGTLTLVSTHETRRYGQIDLDLAMLLAGRCARALENGLLYQQAQVELAERQRAEQALEAEKERLTVTLESIGEGVIATDTAGRVILLNGVGEQLTGWMFAEAVGQPVVEVFDVRDVHTGQKTADPVSQVLAHTSNSEQPAERTKLIGRDGTARTISASGAPIHNKHGELRGVVLVFRDLTLREQLEEDLMRATKLESLGVLAGGIAHDFNNMLTGILANVSLATEMLPQGTELWNCLHDAEKAAQRARVLTAQLLTFAKGGAPVRRPIRLGPAVREAAALAVTGSKSQVRFDIAEDLWPVAADAGQIGQVVQNLVLNAAQAMPEGGSVHVRVDNRLATAARNRLPEPWVRITVSDTGVGIAADVLPRIFEPYFTTKVSGSGLGLAIAYAIVLKHDGRIEVTSEPGHGTTFLVDLPACTIEPEPLTRRPATAARQAARVLVMDDDELMRKTASTVLRAKGYTVQVARDGTDAVEMYRVALRDGKPFDVVVLDLTVPGGMGGREALALLRQLDPSVRAVVSSGYSDDPLMAEHRAHGFAGIVGKPYTASDLDAAIQAVLVR